jgi:hypothetical protein
LRENQDYGRDLSPVLEGAMSGRKIGTFLVVITILIISLALTLWGAVAAAIVSDLHASI